VFYEVHHSSSTSSESDEGLVQPPAPPPEEETEEESVEQPVVDEIPPEPYTANPNIAALRVEEELKDDRFHDPIDPFAHQTSDRHFTPMQVFGNLYPDGQQAVAYGSEQTGSLPDLRGHKRVKFLEPRSGDFNRTDGFTAPPQKRLAFMEENNDNDDQPPPPRMGFW